MKTEMEAGLVAGRETVMETGMKAEIENGMETGLEKRLGYLDALKGLGILLVVFGHTLIGPLRDGSQLIMNVYQGIYFFHMSLFFCISGVLFEKNASRYEAEGMRKFLGRKGRQLLVPYLFISVLFYGGTWFAGKLPGLGGVTKILGSGETFSVSGMIVSILTTQGHIVRHLWFIYVMFLVMAASFALGETGKKKAVIALLVGAFCVFSIDSRAPVLLLYLARYLFFFQIGRIACPYLSQIVDNGRKMACALCIFLVFLALYTRYFSGAYEFLFFNTAADRVTCALLIVVGGCAACWGLAALAARLEKQGKAKAFKSLGRHSFDIYILHQPLIVTGLATVLYKLRVPAAGIILSALFAGVALPLFLSRFLIRRSRVLTALFLGGRSVRRSSKAAKDAA